jgi:hypothetical protein
MIPGKYNLVCPQGSTFNQQLTWTINNVPVNLTSYTAKMQVREKHISDVYNLNLTTENGGIVLGGNAGTIRLIANATSTAAIIAKEYVYDLELNSGGEVIRLIEGKFIVTPEVTR